MFRAITILSVAFALVLGSLGLPVYVHACQMSVTRTAAMDASCPICNPKPACPSCSAKQQKTSIHASQHGMAIKASPCCSEHEVVQRTDASVLVKSTTLPLPLPVALVTVILIRDSAQELKPHTSISHDRSPPLAARAQMAYLLNSTFLI
jgi:hypothetical protein